MKSMKQDLQDERIRQQDKVKNERTKLKTGDQSNTIMEIINKFEIIQNRIYEAKYPIRGQKNAENKHTDGESLRRELIDTSDIKCLIQQEKINCSSFWGNLVFCPIHGRGENSIFIY